MKLKDDKRCLIVIIKGKEGKDHPIIYLMYKYGELRQNLSDNYQ